MSNEEIIELVRNIFDIKYKCNITILGEICYISVSERDEAFRIARVLKAYVWQKSPFYEVRFPYRRIFTEIGGLI